MSTTTIGGSLVALVTPFDAEGVDESALRRLVNWHIDQGTDGLVPVGTTGESATLSEEEHRQVVDIVVDETNGRIPVVAGAGSNNPQEAITYSNYAAQSGADAALHVAGYYVRPNQAGLYEHFRMVHDATELPIIVYNIPPRAIVDILPETLADIAGLPRVIGVKDATGDLARPLLERQVIRRPFAFLSGEDATAVAYNVSGGTGCISVTANVAPAICAAMQRACADGDYATAARLQDRLLPLHMAMFAEPSPAGAKFAVSLLGHCGPDCRPPIMPLSDATRERIRAAMGALELI
ncbi:MAG: 4-hydroxy-tetrahydrodipicolinate synthase [Pseudomonadota bacterium]